jgi:hypothetical protein
VRDATDEWVGSFDGGDETFVFVETLDPLPIPDRVAAPGDAPEALRLRTSGKVESRPAPPKERGDSGNWLDAHVWTIVAVAGALPALRLPATWLAACAVIAIVLHVLRASQRRSTAKGSADLVVVPGKLAGRILLAAVNPLTWLRLVFGVVAAAVGGVVAAGAVAAAEWLLAHGTDGILAAMRMGVWVHAPAYAACAACLLLLHGIGATYRQRATTASRLARRLPEVAVAGIAVVACVTGVAFTLGGPALDLGVTHSSDGLGWVPPGLRGDVDGLRDQLVAAELDALTNCLDQRQPAHWTTTYTAGNSLAQPDVARLVADPQCARDRRPGRREPPRSVGRDRPSRGREPGRAHHRPARSASRRAADGSTVAARPHARRAGLARDDQGEHGHRPRVFRAYTLVTR